MSESRIVSRSISEKGNDVCNSSNSTRGSSGSRGAARFEFVHKPPKVISTPEVLREMKTIGPIYLSLLRNAQI